MKKILIAVFGLLFTSSIFSQTMQASIGPGTSSTRIKIYVRPITAVNGNISTFQFDVAIASGIAPVPTLSIIGVPAFGTGWVISPSYLEDGFRHYEIISAAAGTLVLNAGMELEVMELEFAGGPVASNNVALYTLPGGGVNTGNALFLCTGAANSVEGQLYYNRGGVTVVNNLSYTGALPSSATISGVTLPINWLVFNAIKQNNDALINWTVSDEGTNDHYELQRSLNGSVFSPVATIAKNAAGSGVHDYAYTDRGITTLGSPVIYYRLKQVDMDGKSSYSEIRKINISLRSDLITVYPNPVKDGFYVVIPGLQQNSQKNIKLVLTSSSGQLVQTKDISSLQAANYYFDVRGLSLAGGNYFLQIIREGVVLDKKQLFISK
jgi:Secretion system C-terminal sorting domain